MRRLNSFFIYCSGADTDLLKECPSETSRYVGIGATIFFTGLFACLAAGYSLFTVFDNIFYAAILGLLWGLMIFNLDRFIVSSMRKRGSIQSQLLMALPRLILAIMISIVIARPLELKIFEKEINAELIILTQEKFQQQEEKVRLRHQPYQDSLRQAIKALNNELSQQKNKRDELVQSALMEADGTGGSRIKNAGPIYKIKRREADNAEREYQELLGSHSGKILKLQTSLEESEVVAKNEIESWNRKTLDGFAARSEALNRLTQNSDAVYFANLFIILLFIAIETAPVFVKLVSYLGPYDNLLNIDENAFAVREIKAIISNHAEAKQDGQSLPEFERKILNDRLNTLLKR